MLLALESSCDETGVALVRVEGDARPRLLAHALHTQVAMHQAYGGVVPELASRDHVRRVLQAVGAVEAHAGAKRIGDQREHVLRAALAVFLELAHVFIHHQLHEVGEFGPWLPAQLLPLRRTVPGPVDRSAGRALRWTSGL